MSNLNALLTRYERTENHELVKSLVDQLTGLKSEVRSANLEDEQERLNRLRNDTNLNPASVPNNPAIKARADVLTECESMAEYLLANINPVKASRPTRIFDTLFPNGKELRPNKVTLLKDVELMIETVKHARNYVSKPETEKQKTNQNYDDHTQTINDYLKTVNKDSKKKKIWGCVLLAISFLVMVASAPAVVLGGAVVAAATAGVGLLPYAIGTLFGGALLASSLGLRGISLAETGAHARKQADLNNQVSALRGPGQKG